MDVLTQLFTKLQTFVALYCTKAKISSKIEQILKPYNFKLYR